MKPGCECCICEYERFVEGLESEKQKIAPESFIGRRNSGPHQPFERNPSASLQSTSGDLQGYRAQEREKIGGRSAGQL